MKLEPKEAEGGVRLGVHHLYYHARSYYAALEPLGKRRQSNRPTLVNHHYHREDWFDLKNSAYIHPDQEEESK